MICSMAWQENHLADGHKDMKKAEKDSAGSLLAMFFVVSAGGMLLVTGMAKLLSGFGNAEVLGTTDPVFKIDFRLLFWIVGGVEVVIAVVCAFSKKIKLPAILIAWLATSFIGYRFGTLLLGWRRPCPCLGSFTDALHIPSQTADTAMKIILAY